MRVPVQRSVFCLTVRDRIPVTISDPPNLRRVVLSNNILMLPFLVMLPRFDRRQLLLSISDNYFRLSTQLPHSFLATLRPEFVARLPTQIANDKGRYHLGIPQQILQSPNLPLVAEDTSDTPPFLVELDRLPDSP